MNDYIKTDYIKLIELIEWSKMTTNAFATHIGMKRSEYLYRMIRNQESLDIKIATLILNTYPEINKNWLLYDKGEMLMENIIDISNIIPIYFNSNDTRIDDYIYAPNFKHCDIAIIMNEKSLEPTVPFGSTIILKKQALDIIIWGQIYYVVTEDIAMVRIVKKSGKSDDSIILETNNSEKYEDIEIQKNEITDMYIVCGVLSKLF